MSKKADGVILIFQSSKLNREVLGAWSYSDSGYLGNIISIVDSDKFESGLDNFLETFDGKFISRSFLKNLVERTLVGCKECCDSDVSFRVEWFKNHLKSLAGERDHRVVKTVFGGEIINSKIPVKLGSLIFYEVPRHGEKILLPFSDQFFCRQQPTKTVAEYCVKAKDKDKALDLADAVFNAFDLSLAFLLAERNLDFTIGILRMRFSPVQQPIVSTEGGLYGVQEKNHNFKSNLDLTNLARFCPDEKDETLVSFFNVVLSPKSEIERKISRAVEWIGEAYLDNNRSSAFLKIVIALEALFKVDEVGVITASIMASMAEQCAYLNGRSAEECVRIEGYVKQLYGLRSSIVHTGSSSVRESDLKKALEFTRATIFNLLLFKQQLEIETMGKLQGLIRVSRYKACPLW